MHSQTQLNAYLLMQRRFDLQSDSLYSRDEMSFVCYSRYFSLSLTAQFQRLLKLSNVTNKNRMHER